MEDFNTELHRRYWEYQKYRFPQWQRFFDHPYKDDTRPPVFLRHQDYRNVIFNPEASQTDIKKLLAFIPQREKHRWYCSMNSSQALAQSVLGNLALYDCLKCLVDIYDDEGIPLVDKTTVLWDDFVMEYKVKYLGEREPRLTSLDGYIPGNHRIAFECKLTEKEVGTCSRPGKERTDPEYCNGTYSKQRLRNARCSLTEIGVLYWQYIPQLFKWRADMDLTPCPLNKTYQLVRNILAVNVQPDGHISQNSGHAVLIYDERNPAFQNGGAGDIAYREVKAALRDSTLLRKCSWQRITQQMRNRNLLPWLTEELARKYGL
jgi:hypothetical protein